MSRAPDAPTRVLLLGPSLDAVSGVTTHLQVLLASALREQFDLHHFQVGSEGRREGSLRRTVRLALGPLAFARALRRTGASVVHVNTSLDRKAFWRDAAHVFVARLMNRRVVYQNHGGDLPSAFVAGRRVRGWALRATVRRSDVVVVLSRAELAGFEQFTGGQSDVRLVPNAIDAEPLLAAPRRAATARPLRLAYVGRIVREKGLFEALGAVASLEARGRSVELAIAGTGPDSDAVTAEARRLGISHLVTFHGAVFGEAKHSLWLGADVFLFPTRHKEGLPYALLEAMAAGCVPVTTRVGAIPDAMDADVHGVLLDRPTLDAIADAIVRLDDDRARLDAMRAQCRARVREHYTLASVADAFGDVYSSLAGAR